MRNDVNIIPFTAKRVPQSCATLLEQIVNASTSIPPIAQCTEDEHGKTLIAKRRLRRETGTTRQEHFSIHHPQEVEASPRLITGESPTDHPQPKG